MIEAALVMPFLAIVVFGTVDIGRAFALRNRLTNMAREGAFYAQYHPHDVTGCSPTSITALALAEDTDVTGATVTVTRSDGVAMTNLCGAGPTYGVRVNVTVTKQMTVFTPFVGAVTGSTVRVSSTVQVIMQG